MQIILDVYVIAVFIYCSSLCKVDNEYDDKYTKPTSWSTQTTYTMRNARSKPLWNTSQCGRLEASNEKMDSVHLIAIHSSLVATGRKVNVKSLNALFTTETANMSPIWPSSTRQRRRFFFYFRLQDDSSSRINADLHYAHHYSPVHTLVMGGIQKFPTVISLPEIPRYQYTAVFNQKTVSWELKLLYSPSAV